MKTILFLSVLFFSNVLAAQHKNAVWCFGDSAGINFSTGNPIPIVTGINSRGSAVSICDSTGQLLFYAGGSPDPVFGGSPQSVKVRDSLHQIMPNGDSIVGFEWYRELIITPNPGTVNEYYLFSIGVTPVFGFYYSVIDMSQNGGLGAVTLKNVQLENFAAVDGMKAIKNGDGRDWWIAIRNATNYGNEHYLYSVTPSGISPPFIQSVGSANHTNAGRYCFSSDGSKLAFINYIGLMEIYDFDRCTGIVSNPITIHPEPTAAPYHHFWSAEFSPNGRFLYVTAYNDTCYLYQYDLQSTNPAVTRITLETITNDLIGIGSVSLAPDGKIYLSNGWECQWLICYPYPDSVYNSVNMNLSVINYPDSLGTACGYAPYSFYLNGHRTYVGLPNNPDYDMSRLQGSMCDTIQWTGVKEQRAMGNGQLYVSYISDWQKAFVNAKDIKGRNATLSIYDLNGRIVFSSAKKTLPPYFTQDVDVSKLSYGMYVVSLVTEKEVLVKKFIKE